MTRLQFCAAARCSTSSVAIMQVAMPVTGVAGSPTLNVSTVAADHVTPDSFFMRSMTCWAVSSAAWAAEPRRHPPTPKATARLVRMRCIRRGGTEDRRQRRGFMGYEEREAGEARHSSRHEPEDGDLGAHV